MEAAGRPFREVQEDERLKRLKRNLKLAVLKSRNNSQLPASTHTPISGMSSIHGDNPLSDLSYYSTSVSLSSASAVVLASSNHFNSKTDLIARPGPSPRFQQSSKDQESPGSRNMVPKWNFNIIVDNLMDENCSQKYIDKVIMACDCINELFAMPATNGIDTPPVKAETLDHNSKDQSDRTKKNIYSNIEKKVEKLRNGSGSTLQHRRQPALNSYSRGTSSESNVELPTNRKTCICKQSPALRKMNTPSYTSTDSQQSKNSPFAAKNFPIHSETVEKKLNDSTPVRLKPTRYDFGERSSEQPTPKRRRKRNTVFDSTDPDTETSDSDTAKTVSANHPSFLSDRSQRVLDSKDEHPADRRIVNRGEEGAAHDSFISIISKIIPNLRSGVLSIKKIGVDQIKQNHKRETLRSDSSFSDDQNNNQTQANSQASHRMETEEIPSRRKRGGSHKNDKIDTASQNNQPAGCNSKNISLRMSSYGRHILPPLDYWNGERATLKGDKLVYTPGATRSGNSTILKRLLELPVPKRKKTE